MTKPHSSPQLAHWLFAVQLFWVPLFNELISFCSRESYNALTNWLTDARTLASPNIVIILVGNKKDLESEREVTFMEATRFAQENGVCVCVSNVVQFTTFLCILSTYKVLRELHRWFILPTLKTGTHLAASCMWIHSTCPQ